MAEVRFYHLKSKPLELALPEILTKAWEQGRRSVVRTADAARLKYIDDKLWTYKQRSFLPHGSAKLGKPQSQPIWVTDKDENPNGAEILMLIDGTTPWGLEDFSLCCMMFDGNDAAAVQGARSQWKTLKDAGHTLTYWQQDEAGKWTEKAA